MSWSLLLVLAVGAFFWWVFRWSSSSAPSDTNHVSASPNLPAEPKPNHYVRGQDIFYSSDFMLPDVETAAFTLDSDGLPTGHFAFQRDRLVIVTDSGIVNPHSRIVHKLGIYTFAIRGTSHYGAAGKRADDDFESPTMAALGDFRPGVEVLLRREPENPFGASAIAVYAHDRSQRVGYVNKQNSTRIAPLMDNGVELVAISTRGSAPGANEVAPHVLVTTPDKMARLKGGLRSPR